MARMTSPAARPASRASAQAASTASQPMAGHRPQDLDELTVAIGVLGELGTDLGQAGWQVPVLEGRAVAQRTGLLQQNRQIVPRIIDDLVAPEVARMIGNNLVVEEHDDA